MNKKTYNLLFVKILQFQANTWQNQKVKKKSCRKTDKKKVVFTREVIKPVK